MSQNLSSVAVLIGALRVNCLMLCHGSVPIYLFFIIFQNLALTIQRKMAENLAIAKAREDAVSFNSLPT